MKLTVDVRIANDWNDVPVHVEIAEEIIEGDFTDPQRAGVVADAIERIAGEVVGKAKSQVERRLNAEMTKQLADARAREAESVL